MRSSSRKQVAENNRGLDGRFTTLHSRLYNALYLGFSDDEGGRRCSTDVERQRHLVRSIDAFLDIISNDILQHPLVKKSVADVIPALGATLLEKNEEVMKLASKVFVKMVNVIPSSIIAPHLLDVIHPISSSLSSCILAVVVSCATALNLILSNLSSKREREVWNILKETEAINNIIRHIQSGGSKPPEFFLETITLLSKILRRWPSSRFCIWNNNGFMEVIASLSLQPMLSVRAAILQLYSTIALCRNGAKKLLESGNAPLQLMIESMDGLNPNYLRLAGFQLAECFAVSEEGRLKMMEAYCEPLVKAIINGLSLHSGKLTKDQMSLVKTACCVSKIICWPGGHHDHFWKLKIQSVLLKLLLDDIRIKQLPEHFFSFEEVEALANIGLNANFQPALKPHVWDILGGLAAHCAEVFTLQMPAHCAEVFTLKMLQSEPHLQILITCACLGFVDSLRSARQSCQNVVNESVSRAVLLMIYSPSNDIASYTRSVLSRLLKSNAKENIKYLLNTLNATSSGVSNTMSANLLVINLMSLACHLGIPRYCKYVVQNQGIEILLSLIKILSSNHVQAEKRNTCVHFCDHDLKMCCYECEEEDWQGNETFLLYGLLGLAELVHHSGSVIFKSNKAQIITDVQEICVNSCASGPKWYGAYLLSYFGFYGFPSKLGNITGSVISGDENTNLTFILGNKERVNVHAVILKIRCPSLLRSTGRETLKGDFGSKERRLSNNVDHKALLKLLEYVYSGHLKAEAELVPKLRTLARHCELQPLLQMLRKIRPQWRTRFPSFDLTAALGPDGSCFADIILEAKGNTPENWMCKTCSLTQPHLHAHKAILSASCEHMHKMLSSGMQESWSEIIKIDLGWEALVRLVNWFYSGKLLPKPKDRCLWQNLKEQEKLDEVIPYVELYCLSDCWLLEDIHKECSEVIAACLDSTKLAIKILQIGVDCLQWDLVDMAAKFMAPSYRRLCLSGEFSELDEQLVEIVHSASVLVSIRGAHI